MCTSTFEWHKSSYAREVLATRMKAQLEADKVIRMEKEKKTKGAASLESENGDIPFEAMGE